MHSGMVCHVICLKTAMAEGEFSMERRRLGSKPQGGKAEAEVSSSLLCLHCKCLLKMLKVKTAPKPLFDPPVWKGTLGEGSFPHVLRPFQRNIPVMVSRG